MAESKVSLREIFLSSPEPWSRIRMPTLDRVAWFGASNFQILMDNLQEKKAHTAECIEGAQKRVNAIGGKTIWYIKKLGEESPKHGTTTFNRCGGCIYRRDESLGLPLTHRPAGCSLILGNIPDGENSFYEYHDFLDSTACVITKKSDQGFLNTCSQGVIDELTALREERLRIDHSIELIATIIAQAEPKPLFAMFRPWDHFRCGDEVVVCINHEGRDVLTLARAEKVIQNGDFGRVLVRLLDEQFQTGFKRSSLHEFDTKSVRIVSQVEWAYFKANPRYYGTWMGVSQDLGEESRDTIKKIIKAFFQAKINF